MKTSVIHRYSMTRSGVTTRTEVRMDEEGKYHIDTSSFSVDNPEEDTYRSDIHGAMDDRAYVNWLSNAFFNRCYSDSSKSEKAWMIRE